MRLAEAFERGKAFIPFVMAGDPDLETTAAIVRALEAAGADAIELGAPFSDPIADGPVNQRAAERALRAGTTLAKVADLARSLKREGLRAPLILFTYLNPLLAYGRPPEGPSTALRAGFDGVLVLDPADDDPIALLEGIDRVRLAAPSTSEARLRAIGARGGVFVYYVSRYGVTGARADLPERLGCQVARVRSLAGRPVAVGFGVSTPAQAAAVARVADGVVVGSAIVDLVAKRGRDSVEEVGRFAAELAAAVHGQNG